MAKIFPIDFEEKNDIAQDDFILFSDSEDGDKIKKAQYSNLKGEKGDTGTAATICVGSTTTGNPGTCACVTNSGTTSAAVLDFTIPKGVKGDTGARVCQADFSGDDIVFEETDGSSFVLCDAATCLKGDKGDAATICVGSVSTLAPGCSATVNNSGTEYAAIFDFGIPQGCKGDTGASICAAAFSGDDIVFTKDNSSTVTLCNAKTDLKGDKGDTGSQGPSGTITVGSTSTLCPGCDATVTNSGTCCAAVFNFGIPKGEKGDQGPIGCTGATGPSICAAAFNGNNIDFTDTAGCVTTLCDAKICLKGDTGDTGCTGPQGPGATVAIGTTTTLDAGCSATVSNSGTCTDAVLNFGIPKGDKGDTGATGTAATVTVGSTTTGGAGTCACVTNSGTCSAAVLEFTIPKGDKGDTGTAATVSVGTTTTLNPSCCATVNNSGTSSAAVFNFGIPKGDKGDTGCTGPAGNGISCVICTKSGKITTVTTHYTNGTCSCFSVSDGEDGQGSGDMLACVYDPNNHQADAFNYCNFTNTPTIPTDNCQLGNGCGYTTCTGTLTASNISDTAYGSSWNGITTVAPSKNAVYDKICSIDSLISSNATSSNKVMDKNYIDDAINSVTAYYITKNAQGDQFATYAELAAATTFYSGGVARTPTRNDYTIVLADENHDDATTRYIYNSGWEYQYTVNETALTQAQLDALNSGITSCKVSSYDSAVSTVNSLCAVATSGKYCDLSGTPSLCTVATSGKYCDLTGKPTIPTDNCQLSNGCGYTTCTGTISNCAGIISALGYTPYSSSNPSGYTTCTGTLVASDLNGYATTASLCTVATSGKYCDLTGKPTIPTDNCQLANGCGYTTCTGTVVASDLTPYAKSCTLCTVATSGKYCDLSGTPTIPTNNNQLTNGCGYTTCTGTISTCSQIISTLGYTPYNCTNPAGYTTCTGTLTAETVVSGDSGCTYTIKVSNSEPGASTPATTITFVTA